MYATKKIHSDYRKRTYTYQNPNYIGDSRSPEVHGNVNIENFGTSNLWVRETESQ